MSTPTLAITLNIAVPEDILDKYSKFALTKHRIANDVISEVLTRFSDNLEEKPIILSDNQRRQIESIIRVNLNDASELVEQVERLLTINVAGVQVRLSSRLAERLASRSIGVEYHRFVESTITRLLEEFVGMR